MTSPARSRTYHYLTRPERWVGVAVLVALVVCIVLQQSDSSGTRRAAGLGFAALLISAVGLMRLAYRRMQSEKAAPQQRL